MCTQQPKIISTPQEILEPQVSVVITSTPSRTISQVPTLHIIQEQPPNSSGGEQLVQELPNLPPITLSYMNQFHSLIFYLPFPDHQQT